MSASVMPHVGVAPGHGLIARFGATVAVIESGGQDDANPFTTALLASLEAADAAGTQGSDLAWTLAGLLVEHAATVPAFGVAIATSDGFVLLLRGPVTAVVAGGAGATRLSGSSSATWLDHVVTDPAATVSITLADADEIKVDPRYDLRVGLVPGSGVVLTPVSAAAPAAAPVAVPVPAPELVPAPEPEPAPEPVALPDPVPAPEPAAVPARARETVDVAPVVAAEPPQTERLQMPEPATQTMPPRAPARETVMVTTPAAMLVADDGARTPLDRNYVFGREPHHDSLVTSGVAVPVVVRDQDQLVSRVQAYISAVDGVVTVRDANSANGTFIAEPGAPDWTRIGEEAIELPVGWSLRMGRRVYTHEPAVS